MSMQECKEYILPTGDIIEGYWGSDYIINEIFHQNCYGQDFTISQGMTVLDIGANLGIFSLYAASKGAYVFSYEPDVRNYEKLEGNVKRNNRSDSIHTQNIAVHNHDTKIKMFTPETEHFVTSGLITTKESIVNNVSMKSDVKLTISYANARTLKGILEDIPTEHIDLIKIDCEGAEFDILSSASSEDMKKVKNIVMETHGAYPEESICSVVIKLGFSIKTYKKLDHFYQVGYLFASKNCDQLCEQPVAIITGENTFPNGKDIIFDASQSFCVNNIESKLNYRWRLDGLFIDCKDSTITLINISPGDHEIVLEAHTENHMDSAKLNFTVLEMDYFTKKIDYDLLPINKELHMRDSGFKTLRINSDYIPKHFPFASLIVRVFFDRHFDTQNCSIQIHSKEHRLSNLLTEIRLPYVDAHQDLIFDINIGSEKDFKIAWGIE